MKRINIYRIIDVNLNRSREGLRVCEDITRFLCASPALTSQLKSARHRLTVLAKRFPTTSECLLRARNSQQDIGKYLFSANRSKQKKSAIREIFLANIRRSQEATRVLEEFSKIIDKNIADSFSRLRFKLYTLEKKVLLRMK